MRISAAIQQELGDLALMSQLSSRHRPKQRLLALPIQRTHISAGTDQLLRDLQVALVRGEMQWSPTRIVADVDIRAVPNQPAENIEFIVDGRIVQRRTRGPIPLINQSKPSNRKPGLKG